MADMFMNDQTVTANDLNNIAVDLGAAEYSHFPETPPQSAVSALNQITADLTTAGILQIGNKCAVGISENTITVQSGVCVFDSGAKKRIEDTLTIDFMSGVTNYVYFLNDELNNQIRLMNAQSEPVAGDFVMLAQISADKVVTDRRRFSISKVGSGVSLWTVLDNIFPSLDDEIWRSYDTGNPNFTIVIPHDDRWISSQSWIGYPGFVDLSDGEEHAISTFPDNSSRGAHFYKKQGSILLARRGRVNTDTARGVIIF